MAKAKVILGHNIRQLSTLPAKSENSTNNSHMIPFELTRVELLAATAAEIYLFAQTRKLLCEEEAGQVEDLKLCLPKIRPVSSLKLFELAESQLEERTFLEDVEMETLTRLPLDTEGQHEGQRIQHLSLVGSHWKRPN